jgi:DNA-binding beta-propeller fold protein YncE
MQVSLVQPHRPSPFADDAPCPLLAASGARVILGGLDEGVIAAPVRPAANTLFGPRGAALADVHGPLFVCDTGHHRLLVWREAPRADATPADLVFGQPDFVSEGRNARREIGRLTLNVPTGVAVGGGVLAVADAWNDRVLIWHGLPLSATQPPDVVLGQRDFISGLANRGHDKPAADTLNWCYGVAIRGGRLFVADTGNRRVLVWNTMPQITGAPADLVLGQRDFWTRDEGGGGPINEAGMRWPHAVSVDGGRLFVADAGASRIMVWHHLPDTNGAPCDAVLGQTDFVTADHNRGAYDPAAGSLHMPYGVAASAGRLLVADTANSRLLGFGLAELQTGVTADRLAGQNSFHDKGENRWERPGRDTLCWPYGIACCGGTAIVADSGNNRVLLWDAA